jgi:hypothetical protein
MVITVTAAGGRAACCATAGTDTAQIAVARAAWRSPEIKEYILTILSFQFIS